MPRIRPSVQVLLLLLAAAALWTVILPWVRLRTVDFDLQVNRAGLQWALEWERADRAWHNGVWLDTAGAPPQPDGSVHVRQALPDYDLATLTLSCSNAEGTAAALRRLTITSWVFGIPVRTRDMLPYADAGVTGVDRDGEWLRFQDLSQVVALSLRGRTGWGATALVAGYAIVLLTLSLLTWLILLLARLRWRWLARYETWVVLGLALVIGVRVWLALWAPLLVSYDGVQYFSNAQCLLNTGATDQFGHSGFRMPGYSFVLALFLACCYDFGTAIVIFQALLGLLVALFCYDMARKLLPRPWPLVALLYVGFDPVLLTYEHLALTECLSTFAVTLIAWLVVRRLAGADHPPSKLRGLVGALGLGLLCGLAPHVRSNLQVLPVIIPLVVLAVHWRAGQRRRALWQAATVAVTALVCLVPWVARNYRLLGRAQFAPFGDVQKAASYWEVGALDFNQTPAFSAAQWKEIHAAGFMSHVWALEVMMPRMHFELPPGLDPWSVWEARARFLMQESTARHRWNLLKGGLASVSSQLGLWSKFQQFQHGRENLTWSRSLRGEPFAATNLFDNAYTVTGFEAAREKLPRIQRKIGYMLGNTNALCFNDLYFAYEASRPFIALLFLVGFGLAVRVRCRSIVVLALITLAHVLAIAVLLISTIDRYGVPFKPLIAVVAVWSLQELVRNRTLTLRPAQSRVNPARSAEWARAS